MNRFIKKILIFIIIFYCLSLTIDIILTKTIINKAVGYDAEIPEIYQGNIKADLLIIGTSRAKGHYISDIIEDSLKINTYNIGLGAVKFDIVYLMLKEYIKRGNQKPKYITLNIECGMLQKETSIHKPWRLFPFLFFDKDMYSFTHKYIGFKLYYYIIPLIRYTTYRDEIINNYIHSEKILYNGTYPHNDTIKCNGINNEELYSEMQNYSQQPIKWCINEEMEHYLQDLVKYCKQNSIQLQFVYSPEYYLEKNFVSNRDSIINFYKQFCNNNNIIFKDYCYETISYDSAAFGNIMHLNHCGAQQFTQNYYIPFIKECINTCQYQ